VSEGNDWVWTGAEPSGRTGVIGRLITAISRTLLNPPDGASVDVAITTALKQAGAAVKADRAYLLLFRDDAEVMDTTHEWCAEGVEPQIDMMQGIPLSMFEWAWQEGSRHGCLRIPDVAQLPPEAVTEKQIFEIQSIVSIVLVPVYSEETLRGFVGFDAVKAKRNWDDETVALLEALGDMILSALRRDKDLAELRASEQRLRAVFHGSRDAAMLVSPDHVPRMVNEAATRLTGYSHDELTGMNVLDLHRPSDRDTIAAYLRRVVRGDEALWEGDLIRKDGAPLLTELSMRRVDIAGEAFIHAAIRDASDQNRGDEAVRRARDTMQALSDSAQALLVMPGWHGVRVALEHLGQAVGASRVYVCRTRQAPSGEWWLSVRHEWASAGTIGRIENRYWTNVSFTAAGLQSLSAAWEQGEPLIIRDAAALRDRDRAVFMAYGVGALAAFPIWVENERWGLLCYDSRAPRDWEAPELAALRATADLFASLVVRNQQAEALAQSETRHRSLFESSSDAILICDEHWRIQDANRRAADLTGYPREELVRLSANDLHPAMARTVSRHAQEMTGPSEFARFETEFITREGKVFPVEISFCRVGLDTPVYQVIVRDISEQRDLQQHLIQSIEAERKSIGQELHDGLCQELKGLEIEVALLAQRLRAYGGPEAERAEAIGARLNEALGSAYGLVMGMLPAGLDADTFGKALAALGRLVETREDVIVEVDCDPGLDPVDETAANHLYRIAQEAMANAIRHGQATRIDLEWKQEAAGVCLTVTDNGDGFPQGSGAIAGFGISIMRSRAEAIGGALEVNPLDVGGVQVRCWCPRRVVMSNVIGDIDGPR